MRFHIVDDHCSVAGGEDMGAVASREEAEAIIAERVAAGDIGGCRCTRRLEHGYSIQTCEERLRVSLGWQERQAEDFENYALRGAMNLLSYKSSEGIKRELTAEELASHTCHNYSPRRFSDIMNDVYDKMYQKANLLENVEIVDEPESEEGI